MVKSNNFNCGKEQKAAGAEFEIACRRLSRKLSEIIVDLWLTLQK
jgi:hypothetical protein